MRTGFPRLYAIVDRATLDARGVGVREFAQELREAGVQLVQYRDKVNAPQEVLRAAREMESAFEGVEVTRIMNDRADLALLAGWEGVHVGQGDMPVEAVRRLLGEAKDRNRSVSGMTERETTAKTNVVGVSTHNEQQVRAAVEPLFQERDMGQADLQPDYVAVGPVFRTVSKGNADPVVGLELVRRARTMTGLPIVAIGGITLANARSVIEAGADAVAVIGGMFVGGRAVCEVARDFLAILG